MAAPRVVKSRDAVRDLDAIGDWITLDSGLARAEDALTRIDQSLRRLAAFPGMGREHPQYPGSPRIHPSPPWLIVYRPVEEGVLILRVLDGRRDLPPLLGGTES